MKDKKKKDVASNLVSFSDDFDLISVKDAGRVLFRQLPASKSVDEVGLAAASVANNSHIEVLGLLLT